MVDETVLGGVALGLESTEKSLLGTEDLESRGRVLGEVGQRTSVRDEAGGNGSANESLQVGGDVGHLLLEVGGGGLAVVGLLDNSLSEAVDNLEISSRDVETHGDLGGVNDGLSLLTILTNEGSNVVKLVIVQALLVANGQNKLAVGVVVGDNLDQLREVPSVPLANAHEELVDALVLEVDGRAGLDDVIVVAGDAELDLGTGVGVTHTQTGLLDIAVLESTEKLVGVESDTANNVADNVRGIGSLALEAGEEALDRASKVLLGNTENDLGLLAACLGKVEFEDRLEVVRDDTLSNEVNVLKSLDVTPFLKCQLSRVHQHRTPELEIPERAEVGQLDHLAELGEVVDGGLSLLQFQAHRILLMHHLEEGIAHGGFV